MAKLQLFRREHKRTGKSCSPDKGLEPLTLRFLCT